MYDSVVAVDALKAYKQGKYSHVPVMVGATTNDLYGPDGPMVQGAKSIAGTLAQAGVPVYRYRYSYVTEADQAQNLAGAHHAGEIPYFFRTLKERFRDKASSRDREASDLVSSYLVNFIKPGNPNGSKLTPWPQYDATQRSTLDFSGDGSAVIFHD